MTKELLFSNKKHGLQKKKRVEKTRKIPHQPKYPIQK